MGVFAWELELEAAALLQEQPDCPSPNCTIIPFDLPPYNKTVHKATLLYISYNKIAI
jgi:hypothetical protein